MYSSDLQLEIKYLQSKLLFKRSRLEEGLQKNVPVEELKDLFLEIEEIEHKLQACVKSNAKKED